MKVRIVAETTAAIHTRRARCDGKNLHRSSGFRVQGSELEVQGLTSQARASQTFIDSPREYASRTLNPELRTLNRF